MMNTPIQSVFEHTGSPFKWLLMATLAACLPVSVAHAEPREVTLLLEGFGPLVSSKAAERTWGQLKVGRDGQEWDGFIGFATKKGWKFGGIFRSQSAVASWRTLDERGAVPVDRADFFLLAASPAAQELGIRSRAQEIASTVLMLHRRTKARIRLSC